MLEQFKSLRNRQRFIALASVATLLFLGVAAVFTYVSEPDDSRSAGNTAEELAADLFVALGTGIVTSAIFFFVLVYLFGPEERRLVAVSSVDPRSALKLHEDDVRNTSFWYHNGHIGRWVRTEALPELADRARSRGQEHTALIAILDPNDVALCKQYSDYRALIRFQEPNIATENDTLIELLATILKGSMCRSMPGLTVRVFAKSTLDLTRVDISESHAFRTLVDPRAPAVVYSNLPGEAHGFYDAVKLGFEYSVARMTEINLDDAPQQNALSVATVEPFLVARGLRHQPDQAFLEALVERVNSDFHPYR